MIMGKKKSVFLILLLFAMIMSFLSMPTVQAGSVPDDLNPNANDWIYSIAMQSDGKIIMGGRFTTVGGVIRNHIARLNADGTLDTGFDPDVNDWVYTIALQSDGKILIGGYFTTVGGVIRNHVARLNADGTLDTAFDPDGSGQVYSIAMQSNGKILIGGSFTTVGGVIRNHIARLSADGTLDTAFDPDGSGEVYSIAVQSDGKILIGGNFTTVGGVTRKRIALLNSDGTVDTGFDPNANERVYSIAVQSDGKILIGGRFTTVGGVIRNRIARLIEADTTPDKFTFTDQKGADLNMTITSNAITVSGITSLSSIFISGGTYSINGGAYTSVRGYVNNGDGVTVQQISSGNYSTKTDLTLTIGGVSDTFSVTTKAESADAKPDQFTFTEQKGVALNTTVTSNIITVSGITSAASISITGGTYSINGGAYTSARGYVNNGNGVTVQQVSSGNYSTKTDATLTIGGMSTAFSVTTKDATHSDSGGGGCFIATAAFGSPLAGQVEILRQFRDKYLLTNALGQKFVSWYYCNGPVAANWIKEKPLAKVAVQAALYPLIGFSLLLISGYLPFVTVGLLLSTLLYLRLRPKKLSAM